MKARAWLLVAGAALLLTAAAVEAAPSHIDAATKFLLAWGRGNWEELGTVAADKVTVSAGGKESVIDVAGKKADATLVFPFKGLSTVRTDGMVTGVAVDDITVRVGGEEKKGKGTLTLEEKDGKITINKLTVE